MLPINAITIENFKSFGPKQRVPLSRINFLFGPNSHGKSSVLTALGYLFNGLYHKNLQLNKIKFLDSTTDLSLESRLVNHYVKSNFFTIEKEVIYETGPWSKYENVKFPIIVRFTIGDGINREIKEFYAYEIVNGVRVPILKINEEFIEVNTESLLIIDRTGSYISEFERILNKKGIIRFDNSDVVFDTKTIKVSANTVKKRGIIDSKHILSDEYQKLSKFCDSINRLTELLLDNFQVIFDEPEKRQVKEYGLDWLGSSRTVPEQPITVDGEKTFIEDSFLNKKAITDLNEWLSHTDTIHLDYEFLFNESVSSLSGQKLKEFGLRLRDGEVFIPFNHVGSGVSHIFQILLPFFNGSEVLVIQQPEIHLHPSLQVQLMRACIELSKLKNVQLLFETHSEHFVKAAQLEIAKSLNQENSQLKKDDLSILYVSKGESGFSNVKQMELDEPGAFTEPWPDDFFELSADLSLDRLRQSYKSKN